MRLLVLLSFFLIHFGAFADCDLFKEEVKIISEDIRDMFKDLYESGEFVNEASENKSEINNEKLGRLLAETKSKLDRIEHGMSQLKLHQDCACEDFKFQFVDNLLIEIKFWLKKGSDIDLSKPKKTNYEAIKSNSEKALSKATDLQIYFIDPCKEKNNTKEKTPESASEIAEQVKDTVSPIKEPETEIAMTQAEAISTTPENTNQTNENDSSIAKTTEVDSTPIEEEKNSKDALAVETPFEEGTLNEEKTSSENGAGDDVEPNTNTQNNSAEDNSELDVSNTTSKAASSVGGAAVGATAMGAGIAAAAVTSNSTEESETEEPQNELTDAAQESNEIENESNEIATEETNTNSETVKEEEIQPTTKSEKNSTLNAGGMASEGPPNLSGTAIGATALAAGTTTAVVASNNTDEIEKNKEEPIVEPEEAENNLTEDNIEVFDSENQSQPEEVKNVDEPISEAENIKEPISPSVIPAEPLVETSQEEEEEDTRTEPVPTPTPTPVPVPVPAATVSNNFHYAVQIATGNANISEGKYADLGEDIYVIQESGMNKYRIGKYNNLNDAINTKKKAFNGGFLDAFVVAYNNGERIGIPQAKALEKGEKTASVNNSKPTPIESEKIDKSSKIKRNTEVVLAIQIGASITSTDPVYELVKYERRIGMEVHVLQGSPIRFYTGPTKDKNEVERTLGKVKAAGINEAFLIGVANDKRVEYQEALNFLGK